MCRAPLKISLLSGLPVEILQLQLQLQFNLKIWNSVFLAESVSPCFPLTRYCNSILMTSREQRLITKEHIATQTN